MFYRDLQNDDTIEVCDEVWNPTHRQWFPCWVLAGGMYIGRRVDETGLQWRRLVEVDQPMHESHDPQALSAVREASEAAGRAGGLRIRLASAKEIEQLLDRRQELAAERAGRAVVATEQPEETELEQRAWELFVSAMSGEHDITPQQSYCFAANWMAYRDEFRRDGQPADRPRPTSPPPPKVNR